MKFNEFSLVMNNRYILLVFFTILLIDSSYGKMRVFPDFQQLISMSLLLLGNAILQKDFTMSVKKSYTFHFDEVNWISAHHKCLNRQMHLIAITSPEEMNLINKKLTIIGKWSVALNQPPVD